MQHPLEGDGRASELRLILDRGGSCIDVLNAIADYLHRSGNHRWVGPYDVDHVSGEVRNLVFSGPGAPAYLNDQRSAVVGTIDVESDELQAFSEREQVFLEDCAEMLRPLWNRDSQVLDVP